MSEPLLSSLIEHPSVGERLLADFFALLLVLVNELGGHFPELTQQSAQQSALARVDVADDD